MVKIQQEVPLRDRHSFHLDVKARYWADVASGDELVFFYQDESWKDVPKLVLSGGSNVLFTGDYTGLVLHPTFRGIDVVEEDGRSVRVRVGGGENWDRFVAEAVRRGWHGIENLSWIPGHVGTSPVQNIGAYGVEVKDVIEQVEYVSLEDFQLHRLDRCACRFAYRDSIFKHELKGRAVISHVVFRLSKEQAFTLDYPDLKEALATIKTADLASVREAVIAVRRRKLPDPDYLGNAGSFFKNPRVDEDAYGRLKRRHPDMPGFRLAGGGWKIPAGWLVEQCGWKGFRKGDAGVFDRHALILVNHGRAGGKQILALAGKIKSSVVDRFGIVLEPEVTILDSKAVDSMNGRMAD